MIDPHVHCRDGSQAYEETIEHVFKIAAKQGVRKIFDMPNTNPPILSETDVWRRLKLVPQDQKENYFLYLGVTSNRKQLRNAVSVFEKFRQVIGFKLYAGKSVGDLAVINPREQEEIYKTLTFLKYKGVIAVHCEKEDNLRPDLWNPLNPISHSFARPKEAEVEAIKDQIKFVEETGFQGTLHIVHVSCPESVELVAAARKKIKITCGVTPHHVLWDNKMLDRPDGLLYKMNPPLRDEKDVEGIRQQLREGKIDWIETDHAPHAIGEKLFPPYFSGFPSLYLYRDFVEKFLPSIGINKEQITKLTFGNICKTFGDKLK